MPAHQHIRIASVNMRKRNAVTHALLNSDTDTNLLLIQEPWFHKIGTARQDDARQGTDILGGVAAPKWDLIYPGLSEGQRPKVMAYARKNTAQNIDAPHFTAVPRIDICTHPTLQVLDIILNDEQWRVIHFYHDVRDNTSMQALLALDIDASTPTLLIGDFNLHSRSWSTPDTPRSPQATQFEIWAATNLLTLANNPGEVTRRGAEHERDSVIDLAWYNDAAIQHATFTGLEVDWAGSLGSDHAMLRITGNPTETFIPDHYEDLGHLVDPEKEEEWIQAFKARSLPFLFAQHPPSPDEVEEAAKALTDDIQWTNRKVLDRRRPPHPRASPWWTADCAAATQTLHDAMDPEERKVAHARLRGTVRAAKRKWADDYIREAQLWEVAKWRHGRKLSKVPSLQGTEGLAHTHEEVSNILSRRFFPQDPPIVDPQFTDDPDPLPTRTLKRIDEDFISPLIKKASKRSAPGISGHTWTLVKWVWEADPKRLTHLLQACLLAGHHPSIWKEAVVCVIPKPNRADYTLAKNFRPISLLECMGKLLEKVVAKLIYRDLTNHDLVATTQFGGRNASSTLDAGLALLHDIQAAHQSGLRTGILLFDIQGFFDNINHDRLTRIFADLGFAPELVSWCKSFLKDRTVRLKFNGRTSDPFDFEVGTPQGSPVSPVLSIIYTSPLLHKMRNWARAALGMYIDDGVIFACGREWKQIEDTIRKGYTECAEWLTRAGLNIEPDKSELLFFRKRGEKSDPPPYIHLPNHALQTYYRVPAANTIRYLGFFFDNRLNWAHHVNTVCNRARATLKALQLLGNSVRGLDQASWRLAYNAICLPVLTYGCQLWYTGKQVMLVKKLQTVQNDAVRIISGTFRTTPREPLHQLLTILPMNLRLDMLTQSTALRLYKAPRSSQLLKRLGRAWHTPAPNDTLPPIPARAGIVTTLRTLAAKIPPGGPRIELFPTLPQGAPHWGGRVTLIPKQDGWDYTQISEEIKNACHQGLSTNVYCEAVCSNRNRDDGRQLGAASAMSYHKGRESQHTVKIFGEAVTITDAWTRALTPALDTIAIHLSNKPAQHQETFKILLSSNLALHRALDPSTHEEQATSLSHLERLSALFNTHPNTNIILQWLPKKIHFAGFRRAKQKALSAIRSFNTDTIQEPPSIKKLKETAKDKATAAWAEKWHLAPRNSLAYRTALRAPPDGRTHHTFHPERLMNKQPERVRGEKKLIKFSRLTHSTFYRFVTGHAFTGEYTQRFYPLHTQDQIACPCGEPVQTIEHVLLHCPRYSEARQKFLAANGRPRTLPQLFDKPENVLEMLRFLEETGACAKPRERWEPG
jgi:Reverse transcriptase (RNA-dependent DNA polymerase)/Endonuclease-reverse transcriptase